MDYFLSELIYLIYFVTSNTNTLQHVKKSNTRFAAGAFVRSFVHYCGQGSSLLWTPALRPLCRSNAPAQGEEGNW